MVEEAATIVVSRHVERPSRPLDEGVYELPQNRRDVRRMSKPMGLSSAERLHERAFTRILGGGQVDAEALPPPSAA